MNYMSRFDPELSIIAQPLRELTSSKNTWIWLNTTLMLLSWSNIRFPSVSPFNSLIYRKPHTWKSVLVLLALGVLLQNPEEKEYEQGQYLDINPYVHKLPGLNHLKPVVFAHQSFSATEHRHMNNECELLGVLS